MIRSGTSWYPRHNMSQRLKASGNLSYLDFIRTVEKAWKKGHPDIPLIAAGTAPQASYPCIVYGLETRRPMEGEPKPRPREIVNTGSSIELNGEIVKTGEALIVLGQRFQNIVKFTAIDEVDADGSQIVEELIEAFEDFMMEHTPLYKYLGLSDFFYNRRYPDSEEARPAEGIVKRSVSYIVTTEKILHVPVKKLEQIEYLIRIDDDPFQAATPPWPDPLDDNYALYYELLAKGEDVHLVDGIEQTEILDGDGH